EPLQFGALLRGKLLGVLTRGPPGLVGGLGAGLLELLDRLVDLGAGVEQIAPCALPRLALGGALSFADIPFALREIGDPLASVVEDRGRFLLALRELFFALLQSLDERGDVALVLRQ